MKKTKANGQHYLSKYTPQVPVDAYIHARSGMTDAAIAKALGVNAQTFADWCKRESALVYALERARDGVDGRSGQTFREYVYGQLRPELRELWDKIEMWQDHPSGIEKIEAILEGRGVRVRQQLWIHAMIECNFNASEACRKVNVPWGQLQQWKDRDPDFPALIDEIHVHKKNFFEGSLIKLVKSGNVLATLFANKTQNRDRGYGEKVTVSGSIHHNVSGTINVNHYVRVDTLNLPLDVRVQIRDAMRKLKQAEPVEGEETQQPINVPALALSDDEDQGDEAHSSGAASE